jgi:hypothetical protein
LKEQKAVPLWNQYVPMQKRDEVYKKDSSPARKTKRSLSKREREV